MPKCNALYYQLVTQDGNQLAIYPQQVNDDLSVWVLHYIRNYAQQKIKFLNTDIKDIIYQLF